MKKLVLATVVASVACGAAADPKFHKAINFAALSDYDTKTIEVSGVVPQRCLLRIGKYGTVKLDEVLQNAKMSADDVSANMNEKVRIANLRAWCNYGKSLDISFSSENGGLQRDRGHQKIAYNLSTDAMASVFSTGQAQNVTAFSVNGWDAGQKHLTNTLERIPLYIQPEKAGFATAGTYSDTITVTLEAACNCGGNGGHGGGHGGGGH
ncbi:spore coat protein U domain-containing protein [Vibrio agarivorans]|uniref:spore coat protein U domain-containing protein n=1 Tax=Vibrio agarivorans TaxID=153622 RepID=UPI0022320B79|nr:spore coat protein U domain-containing protein [Vibrio agarivorans]MDN3663470.1 spore coat protein U domain-containing protein [Vibrio agarivorans]